MLMLALGNKADDLEGTLGWRVSEIVGLDGSCELCSELSTFCERNRGLKTIRPEIPNE